MSKPSDDVLDFINSLPDSRSGTPKPKTANTNKDDKDEDFLEFLDELAQHEKKKPSTPKPSSKFEPKKKKEEEPASKEKEEEADVSKSGEPEPKPEQKQENANDELDIDPLGSITNWWSKEGSTKVSSLWGTITSNAEKLGEQTYQLASTTTNQINQQRQKFLEEGDEEATGSDNINNLSGRLNSILLTMSNQIKQGLISQDDELLNVLVIYDMYNMHYLDKLAFENFNRVMTQVEGGIRVAVSKINHNDHSEEDNHGKNNINLNMFHGKVIDGEKLCFANLESSIKDYEKLTGAEATEEKSEEKSEEKAQQKKDFDQINTSNVFISVQPITTRLETKSEEDPEEDKPILIEGNNSDSFAFTIILKDITNNITIITKTQAFPLKWARWMNGDGLVASDEPSEAIDASEWVKDWIRDGLDLSFGVVAQEYVIKRMGI